jgi:glycerophosphoryl diester phosphodiesterase
MPEYRRPQIIAHRGGRKWAPENTLEAFKRSLEAGFDGIELDIQRCATGELLVFHDDELSRTTNGVGRISDFSLDELRSLDAGSWFSPEFSGISMPLLSEVLQLIDGRLTLHIEIKNAPFPFSGIEEELLSILAGYKHPEKIVISSFDHYCLSKISKLSVERRYKLAFLAEAILVDVAEYAKKLSASFYHPSTHVATATLVNEAHAAGLGVNVWTANTTFDWERLLKLGVDGIITDDPQGLAAFLERIEKSRN